MPVKEVGALVLFFFSITFRLERVAERSRWRRMPSARIGARVRSLSSLGLAEAAGRDVISFEKAEDTSIDDAPMWVKTEDFPQVPRTMLDPSRWKKLLRKSA